MQIDRKVFIANQGAHDYTDALRYGTLVYVTKGTLGKHALGTMARSWADVIRDSHSEDMIVSSSLTTLCSIGTALFAMKHKRLNLLMFRNGQYILRTLLLEQLIENMSEELSLRKR